jgi:hypothetical protein
LRCAFMYGRSDGHVKTSLGNRTRDYRWLVPRAASWYGIG